MSRKAAPRTETAAERVIRFIETHLLIPEGKDVGKPVSLRDWQKDVIRGIYDQPTRQAILTMGRKNGKTSLIAMLLLAHLVGPEAVRNGQIYSAAQSRDQAAVVFSLAAKMVRMSAELSAHVTVRDSVKELVSSLTGVKYKALSADAATAYGLSPTLVIHDELGQVKGPRSELYDALETAMGAHESPLSIIISTQAPTDSDLLSLLIDDAKNSGDPSLRLFMYAAEPGDDPWSPETWKKANPALGDFLSLETLRKTADKAKRLPAAEKSFLNLHMNMRIAGADLFMAPSVWKVGARPVDESVFSWAKVYGGLDLSSRQDLTALVLVAADEDDVKHVRCHFWAPEHGLHDRAKRDRAPYDLWAQQGFLTLTPGASVDYRWVASKIVEIAEDVDLAVIGFDRYRIHDLKRELEELESDVPLQEVGQGFKDMSPAIEALEIEAVNGRIVHGDNPILNWAAQSAVVVFDPAKNRKLNKSVSTGRIDGMVALAMAMRMIGREGAAPVSVYEELARAS